MAKTNGKAVDRGGVFGLGWGGNDGPRLTPWPAGRQLTSKEQDEQMRLTATFTLPPDAGPLARRIYDALTTDRKSVKLAASSGLLAFRVGQALAGETTSTKDVDSELAERVRKALE